MEHIGNLDIDKLNNERAQNSISIYISASEADPDTKENEHRIKLKNKIKKAKKILTEKGYKEEDAENYLQPAYDIIEDAQLLRNLWGGLAIFLNEKNFSYYNVDNNWEDFAYVGNEFYLAPVIEPITYNQVFYILSINLSQVRLFKADRFNIKELKVDEFIPENMEEAIGFDFKDQLFQHVSAHTGQGQTFYHGHAEGEEEKKEEIKRFLQEVDKGLMSIMHNKKAPLIIASVDYIFSGFKQITEYKNLLDKNISTSPKEVKTSEIHEKGWNIIQDVMKETIKKDIDRYNESKMKSEIVEDIVLRALQGRIDTLFVNKDVHEWGKIDEDSFKVKAHDERQPEDKELLNFAITKTYLTNGKIHFLSPGELPEGNSKMCAIYRY